MYHFGKEIVPIIKKDKINLLIGKKRVGTLRFSDKNEYKLHIFKGNEFYLKQFKGFHCEEMKDYKPIEHYVLIIEIDASDTTQLRTNFHLR